MLFNRFYNESGDDQGREDYFMDVDRMVNEGLGGGQVTEENGLIEASTTDTMKEQESMMDENEVNS